METYTFTPDQERQVVKNAALRLASSVSLEQLAQAVAYEVEDLVDTLRTRPSQVIGQMIDSKEMRIGIDNFLRGDQPFLPGFEIDWTSPELFADPNSENLLTIDKMVIVNQNKAFVEARRKQRQIERFERLYNGEPNQLIDLVLK